MHKDSQNSRSELTVDEAKKKASNIYEEINSGKTKFSDAAVQHSNCPSGQSGGSLGEFKKGMMVKAFEDVEGTSLRRSYVHISDAGQARAFFVSLTEGVDDHGGPYRAIFQTALGEELNELLDIFVPCDNATEDTAENRDQYILNSDNYLVCHNQQII